ncbi:sigma-70 family RNA polymerase sigma factor [Lysinibacillus sp. 54212]|uniref:sigma-70 family RNA polymerase sigma factor n=1 Tax=Lysinibacillus sp. 54212 TaxID=3119829 RepID=UPI002FC6C83D
MSDSHVEQLFVSFIRANKERFYYLAYSYTKNEQDALDVVQDSIQKALQSLRTLKNEDQLKSWFYKIVVRTAIDFLRKHKRTQVMDDRDLAEITPQQIDTYNNIDLADALDTLPTAYREVIILRYFEDLKIEDVAHVLDINLSTAKSRLYKSLKLLKIQLQDEGETE